MTVHLVPSTDLSPETYRDLYDLLISLSMPGWQFVVQEHKTFSNFGFWPEMTSSYVQIPQQDRPVAENKFFGECRKHRNKKGIAPTDMVVLLTNEPGEDNWICGYDRHHNVFVHTQGWSACIPGDPCYPIAYEILACCLREQMGLELESHRAHTEPIGCMNDLCRHKSQVALKLRTGDICMDCLMKLKESEIPDRVIAGALQGFDHLRRQMLFRQGFRKGLTTGGIRIDADYRILLPHQGNLEVKMTPMARTLYLFFLQQPQGLRLSDLSDHRAVLLQLYEQITRFDCRDTLRLSIDRLTDLRQNTLHENRSRVNRAFDEALGTALAEPYKIRGKAGGVYRIGLDPVLIEWMFEK